MDTKQNIYIEGCENVSTGTQIIVNDAFTLGSTKENTIAHSESWIQSQNYKFIPVPALEQVKKNINEFNIAVITGISGDGKTTLARETVKAELEHSTRGSRSFLKISTPHEWPSSVNVNEKAIILIDDLFGSSGFDQATFQNWKPLLTNIMTSIECGHIQLIITIRKDILAEAMGKIDVKDNDIFDKKCIVDLSESFKMTRELKRRYIQMYLSSVFQTVDSSLTTENGDTSTSVQEYDILMSDLDHIIGFPTLCHIFFSEREFLSDSDKFLERVFVNVQKQIDYMFMNQKLKYFALALVFFLELSNQHGVYFENMTMQDWKTLDLIPKIAEAIGVNMTEDSLSSMKTAVLYVTGVFLREKISGLYIFCHEKLQKVVFLSLSKFCHQLLIQECDIRYLLDNVQTSGCKNACPNSITIGHRYESCLFLRLITSMKDDPNLLNSAALKDHCFVNKFFDHLSQIGRLSEILDQTFDPAQFENYSRLSKLITFPSRVSLICFCSDNFQFLKHVLKYKYEHDNPFSCSVLKSDASLTLKMAIAKGNVHVAEFLVDHGISIDNESLLLGSCNAEIVSFLLKRRQWPIRQKCYALFVAGCIGSKDIAARLLQSSSELLFCLTQIHKTLQSIHIQEAITRILNNMECRTCSSIVYACMASKVDILEQTFSSGSFIDDGCSYCRFISQKQCITLVSYLVLSRKWFKEQRTAILKAAHNYGLFDKVQYLCDQNTSLDANKLRECFAHLRINKHLTKCLLLKGKWVNYNMSRAMIIGCTFGNLNIVKFLIQEGTCVDEGALWLSICGFASDTTLLKYLLLNNSWNSKQVSRALQTAEEFRRYESVKCISDYISNSTTGCS